MEYIGILEKDVESIYVCKYEGFIMKDFNYRDLELGLFYVDYKSRRQHVTIDIRLETKECMNWDTLERREMKVFSISAGAWNHIRTDITHGGQMQDTIEYALNYGFKSKLSKKELTRLIEIWNVYHLNDRKSGTKLQTEWVNKFVSESGNYDYKKVCSYLERNGFLYESNEIGFNRVGEGYRYGTAWLCQEIPQEVLKEIETIVNKLIEG